MTLIALIAALAVAASPSSGGPMVDAVRATLPLPQVSLLPPPPSMRGPSFPIATVRRGRRVGLYASPGGHLIQRVGDRTELGSIRVYGIERVDGPWFGVSAQELPNGQIAWIRDDRTALDVSQTQFFVTADVSREQLELHYGNRVLDRFTIGVGSPGSPTPLGDYSVTDGLVGRGLGPWYGCCVLVLSGHQPNLPPGWIGGNRMAIHGTPGATGGAISHGCLRAADPDMISLFARVPLGAPVFIHA